jgi:hypothetical protein
MHFTCGILCLFPLDQVLVTLKKMFYRAIVGLHRSRGFQNLQALAHGGFAINCLDKQGNVELTKDYMKEALRLYGECDFRQLQPCLVFSSIEGGA